MPSSYTEVFIKHDFQADGCATRECQSVEGGIEWYSNHSLILPMRTTLCSLHSLKERKLSHEMLMAHSYAGSSYVYSFRKRTQGMPAAPAILLLCIFLVNLPNAFQYRPAANVV